MRRLLNPLLAPLGYELRRRPRRAAGLGAAQAAALREDYDRTEGMIGFPEAALLHELAGAVTEGCILEVGSYRGRSAVMLARGAREGAGPPVYAIEPHEPFVGERGGTFGPEDRAAFYRAMLATGAYREVRLVNLSSECVAPSWTRPIGLLWLDGDHSYEGVRRDFECWSPHLLPEAPVAFDDSTEPDLGPRILIDELTATGAWREERTVGKVTVLHGA